MHPYPFEEFNDFKQSAWEKALSMFGRFTDCHMDEVVAHIKDDPQDREVVLLNIIDNYETKINDLKAELLVQEDEMKELASLHSQSQGSLRYVKSKLGLLEKNVIVRWLQRWWI